MNYATIGLLCTVTGAIVGILSVFNYMKKGVQEDASCNTRLETKLDYIGKDVSDIKLDFRSQATKISLIEERVTRVEESAKSAHKRLDGIEREE
ncbi:hypothetical protein [Clostridium pasteurianum]|uniref:Uncharacterized protein n=1 Tax=Clostridium pasteurianum BC1 TaxID=86416 RepID=R4K6V2_CLOPA|nr:hypothetical protein [Clostridium pasteurianum]AGK97421.1 hypothetical protein Clopa_2561 [Clostridium pasteurianum BC1]